MIIKNTKLEQKLKDTQKELEHWKSLLDRFLEQKENIKEKESNVADHITPRTFREDSDSSKYAPRKSIKHVSFAEDLPLPTIVKRDDQDAGEATAKRKNGSILKSTDKKMDFETKETPQKHNVPIKTKEIKILNREGEYEENDTQETQVIQKGTMGNNSSIEENQSEIDISPEKTNSSHKSDPDEGNF
jgi:hypothetical protein